MKLFMTALLSSITLNASATEPQPLYAMPAESAPHEATWLQWPHERQYGKTYRDRIEATWVAMAREIVSGEKLHIVAYDSEAKSRIIRQLTTENVPLDSIVFHLFATNDVWVRDNGPIYVRDRSGAPAIEDWGFNGWGDKEPSNYDDQIPQQAAAAQQMPFVELGAKMILEGGAVEIDGQGSLMATRSSILNPNRNPGMTQEQAENLLAAYLGATHFIWLDGVAGLEITDMHIDGFARFGENNTIVTMSREDLRQWDLTDKDIATLYSAENIKGQPYNYVTLPLTRDNVVTTYGKDLGYRGSYINYYLTNDKVLVPNYNDPNDKVANAAVQALYPTRTVVGIDVRNLYANGGMVHCVTQQQPR